MPARRLPAVSSLAVTLAFGHAAVSAQPAPNHQTSRQKYSVEATRIDMPPLIDGALDDEIWSTAAVIDRFTQQEPDAGAPATERTEVRLLYDRQHLYLGIHAFDSQPSGIVATEMRRDSDRLLDEDSFQVILDTFNDSRNGYMFVTTPLGAKLEQQITEEGEGSSRSGSANPNVNRNWDGVWDAAARVTGDGWTAEIAIPMATLRFAAGEAQAWGINFMRNIRRKNEQVFWAPVPKGQTLARVSVAGTLTELRSLSRGLDLKLKPFVLAGVRDSHLRPGARSRSVLRDAGVDLRYGVTSGLNLDVTYNTDFAQVEVDEQQVNLTRFSLQFPEKRDFFLENAGMFKMGTGGQFGSTPYETELFFSRRIGLSDSGQPIPILGGARLTGKSGPHNIALLDIQTDGAFGRPGENFLVGRYSRDVLRRSRIGALVIDKETTGGSAHFNRAIAADANVALGHLTLTSFAAKTATPGFTGKDTALFGRVSYRDPKWELYLNYLDVGEAFNAETGFVQRRGVRVAKAHFSRTPRPQRYGIRVMEPMLVVTYATDQSGRLIGRKVHHMIGTTLTGGSFFNVVFERNLDVLDEPFQVQRNVTIPVGTYNDHELTLTFNTSPARRLYERFSYSPRRFVGFYGGDRRSVTALIGARATRRLSGELQYRHNDVRSPYGDFVLDLGILRVDYALSPRMTIRSLTQYNSLTHEVTSSVRYNFIYRPGSDLYVVYNDLQQTGLVPGAFRPSDRQVVIKFNYLLAR